MEGFDRCRLCFEQIVLHPNPVVRQIAVDEQNLPEFVLEEFELDPDPYVSGGAKARLAAFRAKSERADLEVADSR